MKLVSYDRQGQARVGVVDGDRVIDAGTDLFDLNPGGDGVPFDDVDLLAPVPRPGKVVCIGLNYRDHAAEGGQTLPKSPLLFSKWANAVVGPGAAIVLPPFSDSVDYEAELGVVIGRRAQVVSVADALDHVLGYTCLNDVSARDLQFGDGQWTRGKAQDTFCPIGPWLVTADEVPDPQTLAIQCRVNGQLLQDSNTSEMVFGVAELISFISQGITLEPGDLIATGTPSGVGFARKPPIFLHDGDTVEVSIDGIGTLSNPVRARPD